MMKESMQDESTSPRLLIPVGEDDHLQGPANAAVTLLEYGDYECPHCGQAFPIIKQLQKTMGNRLRIAFRHFPQNSVHPHASVAAQAAEAAGAQGKFWAMHDMLFEHQDELAEIDFMQYALRIGLEPYKFEADLSSERFARKVEQDHEEGLKGGVKRTPTLFINGRHYAGPLEYEALRAAIEQTTS
jgi:protein-disulfide isomerase